MVLFHVSDDLLFSKAFQFGFYYQGQLFFKEIMMTNENSKMYCDTLK